VFVGGRVSCGADVGLLNGHGVVIEERHTGGFNGKEVATGRRNVCEEIVSNLIDFSSPSLATVGL
jgi:hypothetical protein